MKTILIFVMLFNVCYANNNLTKNKPCFGATFLTAALKSHRSEANIFMKKIIINSKKHGVKEILVDDKNFEWLSLWRWSVILQQGIFYAVRNEYNYEAKKQKQIKMHRLILGLTDPKIKGDHKDHDGLNNQECNLRSATNRQNILNSSAKKNGTSKFLGVYKGKGYFRATICSTHLGNFKTEEFAALTYDIAARKLFGEWANLNFKTITKYGSQQDIDNSMQFITKKRKLLSCQRERVVLLYHQGLSKNKIAGMFKVSNMTIGCIIKESLLQKSLIGKLWQLQNIN